MPDRPSTAPIQSPHDKFFKEQFSRLELAREFFQRHLPPVLAQAAQWSTLQLVPGHFVDERLRMQSSDLLYSVRLAEAPLLLYLLFEHKSRPDVWTRFQLLQYVVRIWEQWLKAERPAAGMDARLPPVLPFVLHQGETNWNLSRRLIDLIAFPEELGPELRRFQPDFEHGLLDLHELPLERLGGGALLQLVLSLMKAVREGLIGAWLERVEPALVELLRQPDQLGQLRVLLTYLTVGDERTAPSTFRAMLARVSDEELRRNVMSLAEALKQEGRQEGRQEGQAVLVVRLMRKRWGAIDPEVEARVCSLSSDQLDHLAEALLDFQSPADLMSWMQRLG